MNLLQNSVFESEQKGFIRLAGNFSPQGSVVCWETKEEDQYRLRGTVISCLSAMALKKAVQEGSAKEGVMLLYANAEEDSDTEREIAYEAVEMLAEKSSSTLVVFLTNKDWLLKKRACCRMIYLQGTPGTETPFLYARTNDTLQVDLENRTLYLFVSDLEILCRKYQ